MRTEDRVRLQHILDEAHQAIKFVEGYSFDDFEKDNKTAHAVLRAIEVIGEAASRISSEYKDAHSHIPWNQIVGMRNHLIHVYFDIDYQTIWKTLQNDIPKLIDIITKLINE